MPSLADMELQARKIAELRDKYNDLSDQRKVVSAELEQAEAQMIEWLAEENLSSYRSASGLVTVAYRSSVKTPKTPESRQAFFDFLKQRGLFDSMITVNSQTLNAFYKRELDAAAEAGNPDFEIPGLTEVTLEPTISFRRS